MADQKRKRPIEDDTRAQQSPELDESMESNESQRERSADEPASMADDRGLGDELDSESDVDELDDESSVEEDEEDISGSGR